MARFVLSTKTAVERYRSLKHLGEVWYNLKTNPEVGQIIERETDALLTVTGVGNLKRLKDAQRAVMLVQGESKDELKRIVDEGVGKFIIDNERDLSRLMGVSDTVDVFLRLKMKEHSIYTGKHFVYGIDWKKAIEIVSGLDTQVGIHFHRKTQNIGEWSLVEDLAPVIEGMGDQIHSVNIGGGLPVKYHNSKPETEPILAKIKELKEYLHEKELKLILEPGRYISAPSVRLETEVISAYSKNLVVDASIFNSAMDTYLLNIRLPVEDEVASGHRYLIKGRSPDSLDIFRYKVFFDKEKKDGDRLVFLNAGAYNFHTEFSDLPRIPTVIS